MDKVIRDGKVAVIYSPGFGAGWYTWSDHHKPLLFDPEIVAAVEAGDADAAKARAEAVYPDGYYGSSDCLSIKWLDEGTVFRIDEYDGSEAVVIREDDDWIVA